MDSASTNGIAVAVLTAAMLLAGCTQYAWVKQGATAADVRLQEYECDMQAKTANQGAGLAVGIDRAMDAHRCMSAHGYSEIVAGSGR